MKILAMLVLLLLSGCSHVHIIEREDKLSKIVVDGGFEPCHLRVKGVRRVNYNCEWSF